MRPHLQPFLELLGDGFVPVAIRLALEAVVDGGQRHVRFGEPGVVRDEAFQRCKRCLVVASRHEQRGALVLRARVCRSHGERLAEVPRRVDVVLFFFQNHSQV